MPHVLTAFKTQSEDSSAVAKSIKKRFDRLSGERGIWETHWQDVENYVLPNRKDFTKTLTPGEKRTTQIYDSTAIWANEQLAGALHGLLTNPATRWFTLRTKNKALMEFREVTIWLEAVEDEIYSIFSTPEANFNSQSHEVYLDLGAFGTSIMYIEETPGVGPGLRYKTLPLADVFIVEGVNGHVDTIYRRVEMSARNAITQFGQEALSAKVLKAYEKNPETMVKFIHEVRPRSDRNIERVDPLNKPWSSIYIEEETSWLVKESGFDFFPFLVPRWRKISGERYGRSAAMTALPDIKMLNEMSRTTIRAAQKVVDPPLQVPDDGFFLPVRTTPGGLNFYRSGSQDRIEPLNTNANIPLGLEMEEQRRESILRIFFQDQLRLQKEKVEMTRAEAEIRNQENLRQMSPTVGRVEDEYLDPLLETTIQIAFRQGRFPPPPPIFEQTGISLSIEYVSPIARAQKSGEAVAFQQAMELVQPMMAVSPEISDNFDGDVIARSTRDMFGYPTTYLKSKPAVQNVRTKRGQLAAAAQEREDATIASDVASKINK